MERWSRLTLLCVLLTCLPGCDQNGADAPPHLDLSERTVERAADTPAPRRPSDVLLFGFDPRASLEEDARQYLPFLAYLHRVTGLKFKLHFSGTEPVAEELANGEVDFAAIGATSYILAREQHDVLPLARGLNTRNKAEYRSMIVVRPDSTIRQLADLRGKRFAFGNIDSTQGHLIPRIMLRQAGMDLADLAAYEYTGSHRDCADAVVSGRADACGMQDSLAEVLAAEKQVRVLKTSDYYPSSGIAVSGDVPATIRDQVLVALLAFDPLGRDRDGLYHWDRTEMPNGFGPATPADYAELRRWMVRFGMLKTIDGNPSRTTQ